MSRDIQDFDTLKFDVFYSNQNKKQTAQAHASLRECVLSLIKAHLNN